MQNRIKTLLPFAESHSYSSTRIVENIAATASTYGENALIESQQKKMGLIASENEVPKGCYLSELHEQLGKVVRSNPTTKLPVMEDEAEDPKLSPMYWVSKWVDYSDKIWIRICIV